MAIKVVRARTARLRRSNSQSGKNELERSLEAVTSKVPTRVSGSRCRKPLWVLARGSLVVA